MSGGYRPGQLAKGGDAPRSIPPARGRVGPLRLIAVAESDLIVEGRNFFWPSIPFWFPRLTKSELLTRVNKPQKRIDTNLY